jgi:hypoxanthine phosphoribosyltransferase
MYNYTQAIISHFNNGRQTRSEEEIARIYNVCSECRYFTGKDCSLCGCRVSQTPNAYLNKIAMASQHCPIGKWQNPDILEIPKGTYIKTSMLIEDTIYGSSLLKDYSPTLIMGVARSGLLPATTLATLFHLPLFAVSREGKITDTGCGVRMQDTPISFDRILVVDDSVVSRGTLDRVLSSVRNQYPSSLVKTFVVYCDRQSVNTIDFPVAYYPIPHFFQWNLFNCIYVQGMAVDVNVFRKHPELRPKKYPIKLVVLENHEDKQYLEKENILHLNTCLVDDLDKEIKEKKIWLFVTTRQVEIPIATLLV